ncbi:MAG TPA: cupin domain-containing protein [Chloroflexota bacterium]|nr:cupin domain-containing protein [Chloroflexota bacterium]
MERSTVAVRRWTGPPPDEPMLLRAFTDQGLVPYRWSNGPGDVYAAHRHAYTKRLRVVSGSIRFDLVERGETIELHPGDELVLPAGVVHAAVVGPAGVVCLEAHQSAG